jgi:inositol oxygenase
MTESRPYRNYEQPSRAGVSDFYRVNHRYQTKAFAEAKKAEYGSLLRGKMGIWAAAEQLNTLVDDSDPDTGLSQIEHLLQTSEAIRAAGHPNWFVLTGFVHDLGKILCQYGEPQWAVVGDTFPLGCAFSERIVHAEFFKDNPDAGVHAYRSECGVYEPNCGLDKVTMSWGHDEYMYLVARPYLPEEALYIIRYHSFYAAHQQGAYAHLMDGRDREMFPWVRAFQPFDLYSKTTDRPNVEALRPYYEDLIAEFFPPEIAW